MSAGGVGYGLIPRSILLARPMGLNTGVGKTQNKDGAPATPPPKEAWDPKSLSPSVKELALMKLAAQLAARYGTGIVFRLKVFRSRLFASELFEWLLAAYERVLQPYSYYGVGSWDSLFDAFLRCPPLEKLEEGVETEAAMIDLHAFVGGVDSLVHMDYAYYSAKMPQPERFSLIMKQLQPPLGSQHTTEHGALNQPAETNPPSSRISLVELGMFKLTALFDVRYGQRFHRGLMRRVVTNPQFEFLYYRPDLKEKELFSKETESRYDLFIKLTGAYSRVVKQFGKLDDRDCPATLLELFFGLLQLEKLEEGVETAMIDLHAFVRGVDYFAYIENTGYGCISPPAERLSMMMNRPRPLGSQFSEYHVWSRNQGPPCKVRYPFECLGYCRRDLLFRFPARGITLKELGIMKLTAQFGVRYGDAFDSCLLKRVGRKNPWFGFLLPSNSWNDLYGEFLSAYLEVLRSSEKLKRSDACAAKVVDFFLHRVRLEKFEEGKGTTVAMIDLHAFMGGVDYFAYVGDGDYFAYMQQPERLSMMINRVTEMQPDMPVQIPVGSQSHKCVGDDAQPKLSIGGQLYPRWAVLEELGIMKLTAMFVARYGMYFYWDLWKKVGMKPQFKFMEASDRNFRVYNRIADAYEGVLRPADPYDINANASTATVVDAFLSRLQLEKLEEGQVTAMLDLHAFLCGVDYFAHVEVEDEEDDNCTFMTHPILLSSMLNRLIRPPPGSSRLFYPYPPLHLPEEPEPKRRKV